jgi:hypothetical protein
MSARFPFDAAKAQTLFNYLASGCGLRAALGQAEIAPECFRQWMAGSRPVHFAFQIAVRKNRTAPLAMAEIEIFNSDKKTWLRYGPGGWPRRSRLRTKGKGESARPIDVRHLPQWWSFRRALLGQLQSSPELRDRFAAVLDEMVRARKGGVAPAPAALVRLPDGGTKSQ